MSWYPDMSTITMMAEGDHVRVVGWLSDQHSFPVGGSSPQFLARLKEFCSRWGDGLEPLAWGIFMGTHSCEFCQDFMASGNIGIPCGDLLFVALEMVGHYVEVHTYAPPSEFIAAVLTAPLPGSREYHDAVAKFRNAHRGKSRMNPIE